jgi:FeS assembly SUF system regulator
MLRITRQTDYGVIMLTQLAAQPGRVFSTPELAAPLIPVPMAGKVLKALARSGILVSHRGATGGYSLARAPESITVAQILVALEGPIALTECIALGPGECDQERGCPTRANWRRLNEVVARALDGVTLADMVEGSSSVPGRAIPPAMRLPVLAATTTATTEGR